MTDNQWSNSWATPVAPSVEKPIVEQPIEPVNPLDKLSRDEVLLKWQELKTALTNAKEAEMEMRKYVVKRAFPDPEEGMNKQELGNGYELKANIKFNYNLMDNKTVETVLDKISKIGNTGSFIAERLVSWTPSFLLTEYRQLQEDVKAGSPEAQEILKLVNEMLVISDGAPTLEIKAPKGKK